MHIQEKVALCIRSELVCCDIYERINDRMEFSLAQAKCMPIYHDICYWGEASARIAEGECPGYETDPSVCRCPCEGCKKSCDFHKEGTRV